MAKGDVKKPRKIRVKIYRLEFQQPFNATAFVHCEKGRKKKSRTVSWDGRGYKDIHRIKLPLRRPDKCNVIATGALEVDDVGRIKVKLQRKR